MSAETVRAGRTNFATVQNPRYQGTFTAYLPNEDGSSTCVGVECTHEHRTPEQAITCADRLARRAERRPWSVPEVADELRHRAAVRMVAS